MIDMTGLGSYATFHFVEELDLETLRSGVGRSPATKRLLAGVRKQLDTQVPGKSGCLV